MKKLGVFLSIIIVGIVFFTGFDLYETLQDNLFSTTKDSIEGQIIESELNAKGGTELLVPYESVEKEAEEMAADYDAESVSEVNFLDVESVGFEDLTHCYAYQNMEETLKDLYLEIYMILKERKEDIVVSSLSVADIDYVFQCVMMDHPDIFFVKGYT